MISNRVRKIYFEHIQNRADEECKLNQLIENTGYYKALAKVKPKIELKKIFDLYRSKSDQFTENDYADLNSEICRNGISLNTESILFHGSDKKFTVTEKPISCSTHPAYAIWHARKHRNHQLNGIPIYIYILHIMGNTYLKSCVDFQGSDYGHENEVLLQTGVELDEREKNEICDGVFIIESNI
jgi:hypothetical protein